MDAAHTSACLQDQLRAAGGPGRWAGGAAPTEKPTPALVWASASPGKPTLLSSWHPCGPEQSPRALVGSEGYSGQHPCLGWDSGGLGLPSPPCTYAHPQRKGRVNECNVT